MLLTELTQILFAQVTVPSVPVENVEFSFWDILFHGGVFAKIVMVTVLSLGCLSVF